MLWENDEEEGDLGEQNLVPDSIKGCYVAHFAADWVLRVEQLPVSKKTKNFPDLAFDPESKVLSSVNSSNTDCKSIYITLFHEAFGKHGRMEMNYTRDSDGKVRDCVTFVTILEPSSVMDLCYVDVPSFADLDLYSHISPYVDLSDDVYDEEPSITFAFPLQGEQQSFLCTQGHFGQFTHFYKETCYAVDFRCDVGTPVLAVADGEVIAVSQTTHVSGICAKNLFEWNSIMIKIDARLVVAANKREPLAGEFVYVEYVHIRANSARVSVGERVTKGQVICESGDVGFCPEPHLHLQAHRSDAANSPTVNFYLLGADGAEITPEAGKLYP